MRMIQLTRSIASGIGAILIVGCSAGAKPSADSTAAPAPAATDAAADQQAIRDVNAAWFKSYNAHDAAALAALYADDAVLMVPGMPMARGREAIKSAYEPDVAAMAKAGYTNNEGSSPEYRVSGDLGIETNTFTVTDKSGKQIDAGKYVTVFSRKDGKWSITHDIWNSDGPPPKT